MQVTTHTVNAHTREITVKESAREMQRAYKKSIDDFRMHTKAKGFRKGSDIPAEIVEQEFGTQAIERNALEKYINSEYAKILEKADIMPVAAGEIKEVKTFSPLEAILEIEVVPPVEIDEKKLDKITLERTSVSVELSDIDAEIAEIEKRFTTYEPSDDETAVVESGDRVTIDARGFDKKGGTPIPETQIREYPLVIGSGQFIPGFEDILLGKKLGESVEFPITFPADYGHEDFQNRNVFFEVEIKGIEKAKRPQWDADFIKALRGVETDMAGFRDIMETEIRTRREGEAHAKDEERLLEKLFEISTVEPGPRLIDAETDKHYQEHASRLKGQGVDIHHYFQHAGTTEQAYRDEVVRPEAERRIKAELILQHLQSIRPIEISEKQVNEEVVAITQNYQNPEVRERLQKKLVPGDKSYEDIRTRLAYRAIIDRFFQ